jgi:predicted DNA-binding transcriptional regulator YafY
MGQGRAYVLECCAMADEHMGSAGVSASVNAPVVEGASASASAWTARAFQRRRTFRYRTRIGGIGRFGTFGTYGTFDILDERADGMPYNSKSKIKILYLLKILQEETDAEHGLTMPEIISRLEDYGISAERKSVYSDINALREFDIDVKTYQRNPVEYAIERRAFSLDELMLMVDAIQSCRAITDRQSKMLITNIKTLASNREQELLNRRIHVVGRVKSKNDSVFGNVDLIHEAMRQHCKIEFAYAKVGVDGKRHRTRDGKKHQVTPVGISYDDGFYYLTAWDDHHGNMVEYRLDRMIGTTLLPGVPGTRNEQVATYRYQDNPAVSFGRFTGDETVVTLEAQPDKVEIITDRFGDAATFVGGEDGTARARVKVCKSQQFFGWVAGMGKAITIVGPKSVVDEYHAYLRYLLEE